ncbi:13137_t:CDS:2, partial [Entrophospora sp. SA101]
SFSPDMIKFDPHQLNFNKKKRITKTNINEVGSNKNNKTVCFTIICIKDVYNFSEVPTIPRSGTEYLLQKDQWCFYKPAGSDLYPIQQGNSGYVLQIITNDLSFSNNNALFNISPENYHVDHTSTLFDSSPEYLNYSFDNLDDINKSLYDFYDKKYKSNDRKINIDIESSETILKDLIKWISNANDEALLLKPTIRFITEQ